VAIMNGKVRTCRRLVAGQQLGFIKSNEIYFSVAGNNNTHYKSINLKYEILLLKEWMVRQADTNTIPNLGL